MLLEFKGKFGPLFVKKENIESICPSEEADDSSYQIFVSSDYHSWLRVYNTPEEIREILSGKVFGDIFKEVEEERSKEND